MKKLDKLVLSSFIGPFILTFLVVVFILLMQYMMKYFEDFVGKDLGIAVFAELLGYFSINMTPVAFPLAVLLSSLITFGNLGEHFELTAIKSAGISMTRILLPIFVFVALLTILAYYSNNYIVPKANIKAYALLYDIRQKKPSLDIKEGAFYNGIPGYSIKVNKKFSDGITLKDLIIYDHSKGAGNTDIILADSGRMYTIMNDRYMMLELFNGKSFSESEKVDTRKASSGSKSAINNFVRNEFEKSKLVFSLSSFDLNRTKEELFSQNRMMKTIDQLYYDIDSMRIEVLKTKYELFTSGERYYNYQFTNGLPLTNELLKFVESDSLLRAQYYKIQAPIIEVTPVAEPAMPEKVLPVERKKQSNRKFPTLVSEDESKSEVVIPMTDAEILAAIEAKSEGKTNIQRITKSATDRARYIMNNLKSNNSRIDNRVSEIRTYSIESQKRYSQAVACIIMFLIGAPLGAIIKRGGLGVPVLLSIVFFIVYYVFSMVGEKWAKNEVISITSGVWAANGILLPMGLLFLRQARRDARLFDSDFYAVMISRIRKRLGEKSS